MLERERDRARFETLSGAGAVDDDANADGWPASSESEIASKSDDDGEVKPVQAEDAPV